MYHTKLQWKWEAKKQNKRAAEGFLANHCQFMEATSAEAVVTSVRNFVQGVEGQLQLERGSVVRPLVIMFCTHT